MSDIIYTHISQLLEILNENNTVKKRQSTKVNFICKVCGEKITESLRTIVKNNNELICGHCLGKKTNLKKYGCENPFQNEYVKEKIKRTNLEKYGCENPLQNDSIKEKMKKTNLEKYGCESSFQNEVVKERIKQTNLERYGCEYGFQSEEVKEKIKQTNLERYGCENPSQIKEVKERKKKSNLEKLGCEYGFQSEEVKEKIKQTNLERYGCEYPSQSEEIREKIKQSNLEKYGCENPSQNPSIHRKIFSNRKDKNGGFLSIPEKKFAEMLMNRHLDFEYEFSYNGHHFDFKIGDILVDIDGEYCHGLLTDNDGRHVNGLLDHERPLMANPYRLLVIDSKNIEKGIDELLYMMGIDYEQWIQKIKDSLPKEFPYPYYDEKRMRSDWNKLCTYDYNDRQRLGQSIINNFHRSIWTSHVGNLPSPVEAWNNDELLDKCVRNRFIYNSALSSQPIAYGFNVCKIAPKVSVFNPSSARHLVSEYLGDYSEVFDPFSGFSGRMLGVCSLGKKYIGQDISETAINESLKIKDFLGLNAELSCKDVLNSNGEYDCLFTCSPYGLKETWNSEDSEKTCDEWIDVCLRNFKCKRYLFVVDNTEKYKDNVVEMIKNHSHFILNEEYVIVIDVV